MRTKRAWIRGILIVCFLVIASALPVTAAGKISITSCRIDGSKTRVVVKAKASSKVAGSDGKYYLFALQPYQSSVKSGTKPEAKINAKSGSLSFQCPLDAGTKNSKLYSKFVVAVKKGSGYQVVSDASYITNPEQIAKYTYSFPKAASKKGLQTDDFMTTEKMKKDAKELGVKHAVMTIALDDFMVPKEGAAAEISYKYNGKTYYFNLGTCVGRDEKVRALTQQGAVITFVVVLRDTDAAKALVAPGARGTKRAATVGLNTSNKEGVEYLSALMSFLGERYMDSSKVNGQVVNWVIGNEVDYYGHNNDMGNLSLSKYAKAYAEGFRVASTALKSVYSKARVYISLTHCWNVNQPDGRSFTSKQMLDAFAKAIKEDGAIPWNLAYHAYPQPLTDAKFWDDMATNSTGTQYITMRNIKVLTDYVTSKYGRDVHVILSEQGFTSSSGESMQAAAMAYAYFIAEANSRIDAFVVQRHMDHAAEIGQGLYLGLKDVNGNKKKAWDVFRYMDTSKAKAKTQSLASLVGVKSFEQAISGFRYTKFGSQTGGGSTEGTAIKLNAGWKKANSKQVKNASGQITVSMKTGKSYQGMSKSLEKKTSFEKKSRLQFKVNVSGVAKTKYAQIKVRFYSGKHLLEKKVRVRIGKNQTVTVSAAGWKYSDSVTKLQILAKPSGGGTWKNSGKMKVGSIKQS